MHLDDIPEIATYQILNKNTKEFDEKGVLVTSEGIIHQKYPGDESINGGYGFISKESINFFKTQPFTKRNHEEPRMVYNNFPRKGFDLYVEGFSENFIKFLI